MRTVTAGGFRGAAPPGQHCGGFRGACPAGQHSNPAAEFLEGQP